MLSFYNSKISVAGTDEAGRGCLAGPVTAAAVILPAHFQNQILNDSKVLNLKTRNNLRGCIEGEAICYGVAHVFMEEIDAINILNASILAMHRAIEKLKQAPQHIIVDGNRFKPFGDIPYECIIKGDAKFLSIAAASIIAKNYRDNIMIQLHDEFPEYDWKNNMGYATKKHREALKKYGPTEHHRRSFRLDYD